MSTQLRFSGATIEEALAKASASCGSTARLVFAQKVRRKGVLGLGSKFHYEIVVDADPSAVTAIPQAETSNSMFAAELRSAISGSHQEIRRNERPIGVARSPWVDKYLQNEPGAAMPAMAESSMAESFKRVPLSSDIVAVDLPKGDSPAIVHKRDGSKKVLSDVHRPVWRSSIDESDPMVEVGKPYESTKEDNSSWQAISEAAEEAMRTPDEPPRGDRFGIGRSTGPTGGAEMRRGIGWSELLDISATPAIVDITSKETLLSFSEPLASGDEGGEPIVSSYTLSLTDVYGKPGLDSPQVVLFTGVDGASTRLGFESVSDLFRVEVRDRHAFSIRSGLILPAAQQAARVLEAIEGGRVVSMWIDPADIQTARTSLDGYRTAVVVGLHGRQDRTSMEESLAEIGQVDALSITDIAVAQDPLEFLALGIPIAVIDGSASSMSQWLKYIIRREVA